MIRHIAAVSVIALMACTSPTDANHRSIGIVSGSDVNAAIITPDTVTAGQSFTVDVTTEGLSSCWSPAQTDVEQESARATITAFDTVNGDACYDVITQLHHTTTLRFDRPGAASIVLKGVTGRGDPTQIERVITVK